LHIIGAITSFFCEVLKSCWVGNARKECYVGRSFNLPFVVGAEYAIADHILANSAWTHQNISVGRTLLHFTLHLWLAPFSHYGHFEHFNRDVELWKIIETS
jgi:hypothetical protein